MLFLKFFNKVKAKQLSSYSSYKKNHSEIRISIDKGENFNISLQRVKNRINQSSNQLHGHVFETVSWQSSRATEVTPNVFEWVNFHLSAFLQHYIFNKLV